MNSKSRKFTSDFKQSNCGVIPHDWDCLPFKTIVTNSQYGLSTSSSATSGVPIIGMSQLNNGKIALDRLAFVDISNEQFEYFKIKKDDLIFNRTNSAALVGKSAVAERDLDVVFASYLVRFKINKNLADPKYVGIIFSNDTSLAKLKMLATPGVSQYNINPSSLKNHFWIILPPLQEQKNISSIIDRWDQAIDHTKSLITAKQERRKWLMQQLLTGKKRLPGFDKQWKTVHLGDIFTNRIETDHADLPLIAITGADGVVSREDLVRRDTSSDDKSKYLRICPGDIGYNTMRMWQGVCGFSQIEGIVSPAYTIASPKNYVDGEFMAILFKSLPVIHLFHRHSQGLVNDTLNLKWRHFSEIKVTIPEKKEQKAIAAIFQTADREIEHLHSYLEALRKQKKGLMQQLLTGKVRVKER